MSLEVIIVTVLGILNGLFLYFLAKQDKNKDKKEEEYRSLQNRVSILEGRYVTTEQVKGILAERVEPLENSLRILEREMREGHKDLGREVRETASVLTETVHKLHVLVSDNLGKLTSSIKEIEGKLQARRSGD